MNSHVESKDLHSSQVCHMVPQFPHLHTRIIKLSPACGHDLAFKGSESFACRNRKYQMCRAI